MEPRRHTSGSTTPRCMKTRSVAALRSIPTGPYVVPREFDPDYRQLRITLKLNGEVMQDEGVDAFNQLVGQAITAAIPPDGKLKVLEVGAGTGGTSTFVLPLLPPDRSSYVFTDVSPLFIVRAKERFAAFPFVTYSALDIERDPLQQGFGANEYDIVIAANVLHATTDLKATINRARSLLKPNGLLVLLEVVRKERWIDLSFGMTEGWWRFTDRDLRPSYALIHPHNGRPFSHSADLLMRKRSKQAKTRSTQFFSQGNRRARRALPETGSLLDALT